VRFQAQAIAPSGLSRVAAVRDRSVADGDDSNDLLGLGQLINDPVGANAK
jgi:hypothetical protein